MLGNPQTRSEVYWDQCKTHLRLAEANVENSVIHDNAANYYLYIALSHLAEVVELDINLAAYDEYKYLNNLPFNPNLCCYVKDRIEMLKTLMHEV